MSFSKAIVRYTIITGLVGGAACLVAGPDRLSALAAQTRGKINSEIDKHIEDPIALRSQLRSLEGQYPERIASVRGDLAELREQATQLKRELEVSERVVELSRADLDTMQGMITRAEAIQGGSAIAGSNGYGGETVVRVAFNNESLDLKEAYGKAGKIRQVHNAYSGRINDINRDLGYLGQQEARLTTLLDQLSTEHQEFQAQMWSLDRQVDSIARNDRMIEMMQKRQNTIDEHSRYSAHSLDQVQARFADIRAKQEAKLEAYSGSNNGLNYEDKAKYDLDAHKALTPPTSSFDSTDGAGNTAIPGSAPIRPSIFRKVVPKTIIQIRPEDLRQALPEVKPIAMR